MQKTSEVVVYTKPTPECNRQAFEVCIKGALLWGSMVKTRGCDANDAKDHVGGNSTKNKQKLEVMDLVKKKQ